MLYEQFGKLKYKYRNREFWCQGYYVDTAEKNTRRIAEYIRHQLETDIAGEQLAMSFDSPLKAASNSLHAIIRLSLRVVHALNEENRAMPAYEDPPAMPEGIYSMPSGS